MIEHDNSFTASSISTGMQCPKMYDYKYNKLYRSQPSPAMRIGTMVHRGLEEYWQGKSYEDALHAMAKEAHGCEESDWWRTEEGFVAFNKCRVYLGGYYDKWENADHFNGKDIYTEIEFGFDHWYDTGSGRGADEVRHLRGKMDALVYDRALQEVTIIEHKTTGATISKPGSGYFDNLSMDIQLTIYREAARVFLEGKGVKVPSSEIKIIYDVIETSRGGPRQKSKEQGGKRVVRRKDETDEELAKRKEENQETLEEYHDRLMEFYKSEEGSLRYVRKEVVCLNSEHEQRLQEILRYAKLLGNREFLEIKYTTSCSSYGGCPFVNVCTGRETLESSPNLVKLETKNPELDGKGNNVVSFPAGD